MNKKIKVKGMTCQNCVKHVTEAIESFDGIENVEVSLEKNNAIFDIDESKTNLNDVIKKINEAGYKASTGLFS